MRPMSHILLFDSVVLRENLPKHFELPNSFSIEEIRNVEENVHPDVLIPMKMSE